MLDIIYFLQGFSSPVTDNIFLFISSLTGELVYVAIICAIYWCFSKNKGIISAITLVLSFSVNSVLKNIFMIPRPYVYSDVRQIDIETGYGYSFPSGHSQLSMTFAGLGIINIKRKFIYIFAVALVLLTGLSRMYLGVHTLIDVLGGYAIGLFMIFVSRKFFEHEEKKKIFAIFTLILNIFLTFLINDTDLNSVTYLYTGCVAGFLLDEKFIGFSVEATVLRKVLRYIFGLAAVIAVKLLTSSLPEAVSYICIGLTITFIVPCASCIFAKIADARRK